MASILYHTITLSQRHVNHGYISGDGLRYEIILKRKKDMTDTSNVIEKMKNLGLELCKVQYPDINHFSDFKASDMDHIGEYDLQKFSILRGWF